MTGPVIAAVLIIVVLWGFVGYSLYERWSEQRDRE